MKLLKFILIFLLPINAYAKDEEAYLELLEKWTISPLQKELAPISSPVEISIESTEGRLDLLTLEITNTQPPSLLSNKAVASGKRSIWLRSVSVVFRPRPDEDYIIWIPGKGGEKERRGAPPFTIEAVAKVNLDVSGQMTRALLPMTLQIIPSGLGYAATINYSGEKIPKDQSSPSTALAESGSNPVFTIQSFAKEFLMTVKGRVDVKMTGYQQLYEGIWYK